MRTARPTRVVACCSSCVWLPLSTADLDWCDSRSITPLLRSYSVVRSSILTQFQSAYHYQGRAIALERCTASLVKVRRLLHTGLSEVPNNCLIPCPRGHTVAIDNYADTRNVYCMWPLFSFSRRAKDTPVYIASSYASPCNASNSLHPY